MKKLLVFAALLLPLPFALAGCSHPQPVVYAPPPPPPPDFNAAAQQGYHDGFDAAKRDIANNRPPNFEHHPRFRNPPVPPEAIPEYRHGFREGYNAALHNTPPPPGY
jgi:hypothetical protein